MADDRRSVLVVGASAAGLRCACRVARLQPDWSVRVIEARPVFSFAACGMPYVLSGDVAAAGALRTTEFGVARDVDYFKRYKGVHVIAGQRAAGVDVARRILVVEGPEGRRELAWDELVLATGAEPRRLANQPDHPRVVAFHAWDELHSMRQALERGAIDRVAIVGAGFLGCELAEAFRSLWGAEVVMLEAARAPLPRVLDPDLGACVARQLRANGVRLLLESPVERIQAHDDGVEITAGGETVEAQVAVVAVGVDPTVRLAREAGVTLGPQGAIAVDERLATSVSHVWAVGDCAQVRDAVTGTPAYLPLGSLANRQGRTLANILAGKRDSFPPVTGAVAVKVFDWNVAATGHTAVCAAHHDLRARSVWLSSSDRAHYWPEATEIHIKLVYETSSLRVLGVQAVGRGEVAKRVEMATPLIARGAKLLDLAHLEHAYAPPYAPALEPLAVAAMAALNQEDGVEAVAPGTPFEDQPLLDVRLPGEFEKGPASVARATNVQLGELAGRLDDVDGSTGLVVCAKGVRSAEAVRILRRRGIRARYLGGGLHLRAAMDADGDS